MLQRLRHTVLALAAAAALGASTPACADPVTIVTAVAYVAAGASVIAVTTAAYIALAASIVGGIYARKRASRAAASAREASLAALTDRCVTLMSSEPEPSVIYGRCAVGGWVIDKVTTSKTYVDDNGIIKTRPDALQHIVIGIAGHECQAVHDVFMYGAWIGGWGADGWVTGGPTDAPYGKLHTIQGTTRITFSGAGIGTLVQPQMGYVVTKLLDISQGDSSGSSRSRIHAGATVSGLTISGGPAGGAWDVSYEIAKTISSLRVEAFTGSDSQAASAYLMSVAPGVWTSAHRLRGITGMVLTFDLDDRRHQGIPSDLAFDVSGRKVLDPRTGVTAWSRNPALCAHDWLRARWGHGLGIDDIRDITAIANICDQQVTLTVGGVTTTEARYTVDGAFGVNAGKEAVLADLVEAMGGFASHAAQWALHAGAWTAPVMSLTDDDLAAPIRIIRSSTPLDERFNSAKATYIPSRATKTAEVDPYINTTFVAADGGREWGTFTLPFTNNKARGRNLLRQFVEQSRTGMTIQYAGKMRLWPLEVGDRVSITSAQYAWAGDTFRVLDWQWSPGSPVTLTLVRDIAATYDNADASTADPAPSTRLPDPGVVDVPSAVTAASGTTELLRMGDGTIVPRVRVSWAKPQTIYMTDSGSRTEVSWRRVSDTAWVETRVSGDTVQTYLDGVVDGDVLLIAVRHVNGFGVASRWEAISHKVVGKTAPPAAVTSLVVTEGPTGTRRFAWAHVPEVDHYGYELRYSASTAAVWAQMVYLGRVVGEVLSDDLSDPPDGSWRFAICSIDTTGNYSTVPVYSNVVLSGYGALMASGGLSGNLLANTAFVNRVTSPWTHAGAATLAFFGTESQRDTAQPYAPLGTDAICMRQIGVISGGDAAAARDLVSEHVPVAPGVRYEFSVRLAAHRCSAEVFLEFFTSAMVPIVPADKWSGAVAVGGQQLGQFTHAVVFGVAPTGAAYCRPILRKLNTLAGQADSFCWLLWPYLGVAGAAQTAPSAYSPGVPRTVAQLGYTGDLDATRGAPAGTLVGGRPAETIAAELVAITSDNVLSRPEKPGEIIRYNELINERPGLVATATALGVTSQLTVYTTALSALQSYLTGLGTFWNSNTDTTIVSATYRTNWDSVLQARATLRSQIDLVSSQRATGISLSGNLLANTAFSGKSTASWTHAGAAALAFFGTESQRDAAQPYAPLGADAICMRQVGVISGGDTAAARDLVSEFVPVTPGVRYECSAYFAAHRCNAELYLEFFTAAMVPIVPAAKWAGPVSMGGQQLPQFTRAFTPITAAPAGAAYCRPILRKLNTWSGQPDSYCWLLRPYLGIAGADQTAPSEYTPGVPSMHGHFGLINTSDVQPGAATEVIVSNFNGVICYNDFPILTTISIPSVPYNYRALVSGSIYVLATAPLVSFGESKVNIGLNQSHPSTVNINPGMDWVRVGPTSDATHAEHASIRHSIYVISGGPLTVSLQAMAVAGRSIISGNLIIEIVKL